MKQGYVFTPTLFSMMFLVMLSDAFQVCNDGVPAKYRMDGKLFHPRHLMAVTKLKDIIVRDLLFNED